MTQREYDTMIPSHSWSLLKALDTDCFSRDRTTKISGLHDSSIPSVNGDMSMESFSIEGLILDRSISAPPPNQNMSLTPNDKSWFDSDDLSLLRTTTWKNTSNSLCSSPGASNMNNYDTVPTNNHEIMHGGAIAQLSSLYSATSMSSVVHAKDQNRFGITTTYSRSEPTITGSTTNMTSASLLGSSSLNISSSVNQSRDDQWNNLGMSLRRPASTGIIGRNHINDGLPSPINNFHNLSGIQMVSTPPIDRGRPESHIVVNGQGKDLTQGSSSSARPSFGKGNEQANVTGSDTAMGFTFHFNERGEVKYPEVHHAQSSVQLSHRLEQSHSNFANNIIQNQAKGFDTSGTHCSNSMQYPQIHAFPHHNPSIVAQSRSSVNHSQHNSNPTYSLEGAYNRYASLEKVSDSRIFLNANPGLVILNPPPPGYEHFTMPHRAVAPTTADHHAYHGYLPPMSSYHGQVTYTDSTSFTSNMPVAHHQHYYPTATLPISLHNDQLSTLSPPSYGYLVFQPQQHSSTFLSPHGEHIHSSETSRNGNRNMKPPITTNRDNILSSMQHLSLYGRSNDEHEELSSTEKIKRTKANKNNLAHNTTSKRSDQASSLLEELRVARNQAWTSFTIKGHIADFAQDQNGSRFIQQRLEIADEAEKQLILEEILISMHIIRNDIFGNYVIQKLFELGTSDMKSKLKQTLIGDVVLLSKMIYGCRVVQKALESLDNSDLPVLIHEFKGHLLECILDQNGNHVVQKCIEVLCVRAKNADYIGDSMSASFLRQHCQFIIDTSLESLQILSCHPFGCRVIQRIIEHSIEPNLSRVLDNIAACHTELLDDQYGNYVIQHVLQYGRITDKEKIMRNVLESGLVKLSRQKYASNVVEKLLKYGTPAIRGTIIKDMLKEGDSENSTAAVILMVRDAYANYVVQTALDVAPEGYIKRHLVQELNKHSSQLRNYTFAKHIVSKLGS